MMLNVVPMMLFVFGQNPAEPLPLDQEIGANVSQKDPDKPEPSTAGCLKCQYEYFDLLNICFWQGKCAEAADQFWCACKELYCLESTSYVCGAKEPQREEGIL